MRGSGKYDSIECHGRVHRASHQVAFERLDGTPALVIRKDVPLVRHLCELTSVNNPSSTRFLGDDIAQNGLRRAIAALHLKHGEVEGEL